MSNLSEAFTCSIRRPHYITFNLSLFYRPPSSTIHYSSLSFIHLLIECLNLISLWMILTFPLTNKLIILNLYRVYSIYRHPPILNFIILTPQTNMVIPSISSFPISYPT